MDFRNYSEIIGAVIRERRGYFKFEETYFEFARRQQSITFDFGAYNERAGYLGPIDEAAKTLEGLFRKNRGDVKSFAIDREKKIIVFYF